MNFISCTKWIKKGVAKSIPDNVQLTQEELQKVIDSTKVRIKEEEDEEDENGEQPMEEDDKAAVTSRGYNFEDYDKEDNSFFNLGNLVTDDDYKLEEDYDSEEEDEMIKPTDSIIVVGHIDGDASILEVYVYNEEDGDLYVHHDILLPSVPLCLEWLSYDPTDTKPGNLIAVGSMSCVISIWDLDILGSLEPAYLLGKFSAKKKKNKSHGHKDAVLDIAWNRNYKHILASGSVDKTVLLWDLDSGTASTTFSEFTDKVQSIKWQPSDYHLLLTGSADKTAKLFDCRMTETKRYWLVNEEIEKVAWCPWDNNKIYLGTNEGNLINYDIRLSKEPLWKVQAHEKEISGLELDANCPNLLFTCSADGNVKVWDVESDPAKLRGSKEFGVDEIHSLDLNPDCPYVACIGGTKKGNNFKVVNLFKKMLQPVNTEVIDTTPVVFNDPSTSRLQLTEQALESLSLKSKKIKSKKKFGHKFKNTS